MNEKNKLYHYAFNEEDNVVELYDQINTITQELPNYEFEFLYIENGSTDNTLKT